MVRLLGTLVFLTGLFLLAGVVWWLLQETEAPAAGPGRPPLVIPVTLAGVQRTRLEPRLELTGSVRPERRANLAFTSSGLVRETLVREGDRVEAGETLARLVSRDQELALDLAQANLTLSQRELQKLEAGERPEIVARLAAELEAARADAELARQDEKRSVPLAATDVVSKATHDRTVAARKSAEARVLAAQERHAEALAGTRQVDLDIAAAAVAAAEASVRTAEFELEKTRLQAPFAGVVERRFVAPGDFVVQTDPVFRLVDLSAPEVELEIPARLSSALGTQRRVRLWLEGGGEPLLEAPLSADVPVAVEGTRNFRALLRPAPGTPGSERLLPGMFVRAELLLEPLEEVLVVPLDALRVTETLTLVVRAVPAPEGDGLVAEWVPVRLLGEDPAGVGIESLGGEEPPLSEGDTVVVTGVDLVFPGAPLLPRGRSDGEPPAIEPAATEPPAEEPAR